MTWLTTLPSLITGILRSHTSLQIENMALRHQLGIYHRTCRHPRIRPRDRIFWSWLSRVWSGWREALVIVQPETVIAWRRRKFREHWAWLCRFGKPGRPVVPREVRDLIRRMSSANPFWGAPRIVGELRKIGIELAKSTVERYMVRRRKPPSPWGRLAKAVTCEDGGVRWPCAAARTQNGAPSWPWLVNWPPCSTGCGSLKMSTSR